MTRGPKPRKPSHGRGTAIRHAQKAEWDRVRAAAANPSEVKTYFRCPECGQDHKREDCNAQVS